MLIRDHIQIVDINKWHMAYSRIPPTCSQWSLPKITGHLKAKTFLHPTCGRSKTNTFTLLSPIKTGGLDFQCSAPF
jgi:hypothetical protein